MNVDAATAQEFAAWFRCLADPTRLRVLHELAGAGRPLTVGELVERVGVGQSTVSAHVRRLAEAEFVIITPVATRSEVEVRPDCLQALPEAAARIMARDQGR